MREKERFLVVDFLIKSLTFWLKKKDKYKRKLTVVFDITAGGERLVWDVWGRSGTVGGWSGGGALARMRFWLFTFRDF